MNILEIRQLSKRYGRTQALQPLDLSIESGQIYGILGPNGSGKTTTLGIILGVIRATHGEYQWFENSRPAAARRRIGSLLETPNFYPYLSATNNLRITAKIRGVDSNLIPQYLHTVDLAERANDLYSTYSLGMKQRLAIAATLLGDPEVLIFDEPTNGIDARGIVEIRNIIRSIAERGKTIILASHILDEVEKVCSHVAVLQKGQLVTSGSIAEVLKGDRRTVEIAAANLEQLKSVLDAHSDIESTSLSGGQILATVKPSLDLSQLNRAMFEQNISLSHLAVQKQSLESRFLELTETK